MASRVVQLDALALPDHHYLDASDVVYFAGEYTAGAGHAFSETNQLVLNFKKSVSTRGTAQWQYKERAIARSAAIFRNALKKDIEATFVPVPPSKAKSDPLFDDRMTRLVEAMCVDRPWQAKELVLQKHSVPASHQSSTRRSVEDLVANYLVNESLADAIPTLICIVDDVLTTGCHFKAMKRVLAGRFPAATIIGLFIARRVRQAADASDFDVVD